MIPSSLTYQEKNMDSVMCGPCKLIKNHYSVPVQWLKLVELTEPLRHLQGLAHRAGPHHGDAPDGRDRPEVGEGGRRELHHGAHTVQPVQRAAMMAVVRRLFISILTLSTPSPPFPPPPVL